MRKTKLIAFIGSGLIVSASLSATENGAPTTAAGIYGFGAGFMPPVTDMGMFAIRAATYSAKKVNDAEGNAALNNFSNTVNSLSLTFLKMTEHKIGSASYGFGLVAPMLDMSLEGDVPNAPVHLSGKPSGLADIQVIPYILQWYPSQQLAMNTQLQIQIPTGDYDKTEAITPGLNRWSFSPAFNVTYVSATGFEVSSSFQIDVTTENKATKYQNGIEYRHEFAIGQKVSDWTLGVGGYMYRQLTDDKQEGQNFVNGNKSSVLALGPNINFFRPGLPIVSVHAYKEFKAKNRAEGYTAAVLVANSF